MQARERNKVSTLTLYVVLITVLLLLTMCTLSCYIGKLKFLGILLFGPVETFTFYLFWGILVNFKVFFNLKNYFRVVPVLSTL